MCFRKEAMELVTANNFKRIAEIGVWKGELSRMFYQVADTLLLVDPWQVESLKFPQYSCLMNEPLKTQEELEQIYNDILVDMPKAVVLRMKSLDAVSRVADASLDFVYVDAVHVYDYIHADILAWLPKVKPGGMIAGDDYNLTDVGRAVNELLGNQIIAEGQSGRTWFKIIGAEG
jgi:hypothetical protein